LRPVGEPREQQPVRVQQAGEIRLARVESLRALAALAVVVGHLWVLTRTGAPALVGTYWHRLVYGGGFGVFVFYALSGYLLFWPFVRAHFGDGGGGRGRVSLRRYALNRAVRILPLYYVAIVVLLVLQNGGGTAELWWRHALFVQAMWTDSLNAVDGSLWSVSVEIQFYVLLPFLAAGLARASGRSRLRAAALLLMAAVASDLLRRHLAGRNGDLWGYQLPTTFLFFVAGMTVALLRHAWEERPPPLLDGPLGSSTLWVLASLPMWALLIWRFDLQELAAVGGFLLVAALVLPLRRGAAVAALEWRPLAIVGVASYSVYVWHLPIMQAVGVAPGALGSSFPAVVVLVGGLSVVAGLASYRIIEAPVLRLRRRWAEGAAPQLGSPP
jgi:peptidoglycan/LPS O-acetylase OafA/YrhL